MKFNATVRWNTGTLNITNVSFVFTSGSERFVFTNTTPNGTRNGGAAGLSGDFGYTIAASSLTANLQYTVRVEIRNTTNLGNDGAVNSSFILYTMDSSAPVVQISSPLKGSTVIPSSDVVTFEYTPTDANFGNCSLSLNNNVAKASASDGVSPNISSGVLNRFTHLHNV